MAKTIRHTEDHQAFFGEEDFLNKAQNTSFSGIIFELLSERKPSPDELKLFELILNLSIDHGSETPSAVKVIEEAKAGEPISEAVSEGIEQINDAHGGAIEPLMEILYKLSLKAPLENQFSSSAYRIKNQESRVKELVEKYIKEEKKIPGFGHRIYEVDPRAQLILQTLKDNGLGSEFVQIALDLEQELNSQTGKKLPLNIDGVAAVALCAFGWESELGKAVFIIARTPGLCGQYLNAVKNL